MVTDWFLGENGSDWPLLTRHTVTNILMYLIASMTQFDIKQHIHTGKIEAVLANNF